MKYKIYGNELKIDFYGKGKIMKVDFVRKTLEIVEDASVDGECVFSKDLKAVTCGAHTLNFRDEIYPDWTLGVSADLKRLLYNAYKVQSCLAIIDKYLDDKDILKKSNSEITELLLEKGASETNVFVDKLIKALSNALDFYCSTVDELKVRAAKHVLRCVA